MDVRGNMQLYPMMRVGASLALGIVGGDAFGGALPSWLWLVMVIALVAAVALLRGKPLAEGVLLLLAVAVFGVWITAEREKALDAGLPEGETRYEAVLTSEPRASGRVVRVDLLTVSTPKPIKVRAAILRDTLTNNWACLHAGDGIEAVSRLEKPRSHYANADFDYARWLRVNGFGAQTFIYYKNWNKRGVSLARLSYFERTRISALRLRHKLVARLRQMDMAEGAAALVAAMVLGDKSMLSKSVRDEYSVSGGSHVLALSGLHLGVIYGVLLLVAGSVVRFFRRGCETVARWPDVLVQIVTLTAVWSYVVLVGMPSSVVRSAAMITVYGLATLLGRERLSLNALAVAAVVMLVANPLTLWDVGFQMSFMAVLGIVMIYPWRRLNWLAGMVVVSLAAQLGVAPLVMLYFGRFSCYFLLTNLLVVPCATCILYGGVLLLIAAPLPSPQSSIATAVSLVAGLMNAGVGWIASLPGASIEGIRINWAQTVLIYVCLFCVYRIICITLQRR